MYNIIVKNKELRIYLQINHPSIKTRHYIYKAKITKSKILYECDCTL